MPELLAVYGVRLVQKGMKWVGECPFARWTHSRGTDSHPSFAVVQSVHGSLHYRCQSCGENGPLERMIWRMRNLSGSMDRRAMSIVYGNVLEREESEEIERIPTVQHMDYVFGGPVAGEAIVHKPVRQTVRTAWSTGDAVLFNGGQSLIPGVEPARSTPTLAPDWLIRRMERFQAAPFPEYATKRGISRETYRAWGMGHDVKGLRLVVPIFDKDGALIATTARYYGPDDDECVFCGASRWQPPDPEKPDAPRKKWYECPKCEYRYAKWIHSLGFTREMVLGGVHLYRPGDPVVLVEGPLDGIRLYGAGVRCPLIMFGAGPSVNQMRLAASLTDKVYAMGDADHAGVKMTKDVAEMFASLGFPHVVEPIRYYDVEEVPGKEPGSVIYNVLNKLAGDPDALTVEQIRSVVPPECLGGIG